MFDCQSKSLLGFQYDFLLKPKLFPHRARMKESETENEGNEISKGGGAGEKKKKSVNGKVPTGGKEDLRKE